MESKLLFLLLLVCVSYTVGQDSSDSSSSSDSSDSSGSSESGSSEGDNITADSNKSYPCSLDDWECIQNYFVNTNLCTKTNHKDGDPIHSNTHVSYLPKWNATIYALNEVITFFGSSIETFYISKPTNNLVMTVNYDAINMYAREASFVLHKRGQMPMYLQDYVNVTYVAALTAIIPSAAQRGINGASVTSYNTDAFPPFEIGPKITESTDEVVKAFIEGMMSDVPTAVQELFLTKAPFFFYTYLQEYICNYGIEITGQIMG